MKPIKSYIDQLKFDPKLKKMGIASYLMNVRFVSLLIIGIVLFGLISFVGLPRRLNPEVKIPLISVVTTYPGAGPSEVEDLVTVPIENKLVNAKNLVNLTSSSSENVSVISVEFTSATSVKDARQEVQKLVSQVNDLPESSGEPIINELDFEDVPIWEFVLTTQGSRATLERVALELEDALESVGQIDRVVLTGIEEKEVKVILDEQKIADYGLTPIQLAGIISSGSQSLPAGKVIAGQTVYSVALGESFDTIDGVRNLTLNINGSLIKLGDLAEVSYESTPDQSRSYVSTDKFTNRSGVTASVYKTSSADISQAQVVASKVVEELMAEHDGIVEVITLENVAQDITDQFADLYSNFLSTIFLVFATLFIFLGLRQALIASTSIPLTFLISFIVMSITGQTLNFLSLFAMLLALGLLVDDAIVIISAMTTYYRTGRFTPLEAALLVWRDFLVPIWTTTITTIWAFLPLLLASGIIGEFIKPIPVVVSATLTASTFVAVFITLPLMMIIARLELPRRVEIFFKILFAIVGLVVLANLVSGQPLAILIAVFTILTFGLLIRWRKNLYAKVGKQGKKNIALVGRLSTGGLVNLDSLSENYKQFIHKVISSKGLRKRVMVMLVVVSIFSYSLVPLGLVVNEFFPEADSELVFITLELPTGTATNEVEEKSLILTEKLSTIEEVELVTNEVGRANRSSTGGSASGGNLAAVSLRLKPEEERKRSADQIAKQVRQISADEGLKATVYLQSGGPPAGSDVTVKILGEDLSQLQLIAGQIEDELESYGGVTNIARSIKQGSSKIVFTPDNQALAQYGLSSQDIALWMRTSLSGFNLAEIDFADTDDKTDVTMYMHDRLVYPEELSELSIQTRSGLVPLNELGTFGLEPSPSVINRENNKRALVVSADVEAGFNSTQINTQILEYAQGLDLPKNYEFATGGANEENQKSVESIMKAMVLSLILILTTMVLQLGSFRQSLIVVFVIPLAISGVFIMFALTGTPLSFPALIGVLALFGIVVNNSIMVVDKINQNLKIGMKQLDAISDAASSRLEPILFSSLTTIIGLIPITLSDPIWRGLGGAIISGLLFSGTIMLLVIPVVYTYFYSQE